jgi:hypothetical protein
MPEFLSLQYRLNPLASASAPHKNFQLQIVTRTSAGNVSSISLSPEERRSETASSE